MFTNLFGDGRVTGILALVVGLCLLGLIIIYAWRAFGRGIRPAASRGARQPRLGIVDAFDLDRHRQLVLVRRDNVEHLIMIGGPNDLLIEGEIVRAQPSGAERREPSAAPAPGVAERPGERQPPRMPIEPQPAAPGVTASMSPPPGFAPTLDVKPGLEPAATAPITPPPLRPTLEPVGEQPSAPPAPLSRPGPVTSIGPRPLPPRPAPPVRPMPPVPGAPRPGAPTFAQRPMTAPAVTPPAPPSPAPAEPERAPEPAVATPDPATQAKEQAKEQPPKLTLNIDSLEEEMAKLLGRPVDPPKT